MPTPFRHALAALGQHVGIAARVILPAPLALGHDDAGADAVEEIAVMAHQQYRAGVVGQQLLLLQRR